MEDAYAPDPAKLEALLSAKPKRGGVWEADVFAALSTARDADGEYQPLMTMIVDGATGFVLSARMFGRAYRAIDALGDDLLDAAARGSALPESVDVKDAATAAGLAAFAAKLGVALESDRPLNALSAARRALSVPRSGPARPTRRPTRRG